jgi:uncharacterized damage-inducible protein DinB
MDQLISLLRFYKGWETYQRMLLRVIEPLSPKQLALPVSSSKWTIGRTVQHIVANRVWWFQVWMGEGSPDLAPILKWDPSDFGEPPMLQPAEIITGLQSTWEMVANALAGWTSSDLERVIAPPKSLSKEEQATFGDTPVDWIIWHVFEHEIHHGGEISLILGQFGLPGIYGDA